MVANCIATGEQPKRQTRNEKEIGEGDSVRMVPCQESRVYSDAFDTGWIDTSKDTDADIKVWHLTNPEPEAKTFPTAPDGRRQN